MSVTARKRKEELAQALKKLIQSKGKTLAMRYQLLFDDLRSQSDIVSYFIFLIGKVWIDLCKMGVFTLLLFLCCEADVLHHPVLVIMELGSMFIQIALIQRRWIPVTWCLFLKP